MGEAVGIGEGEAMGGNGVPAPVQAKRNDAVNTRVIAARIVRAEEAMGFLEATEPTFNEPVEILRRTQSSERRRLTDEGLTIGL